MRLYSLSRCKFTEVLVVGSRQFDISFSFTKSNSCFLGGRELNSAIDGYKLESNLCSAISSKRVIFGAMAV